MSIYRFFLSIIFVMFLFISLAGRNIYAATTEENLDKMLRGLNCGGLNQACCDLSKVDIPAVGFDLPSPFDVLVIPINVVLNLLIGKVEKTTTTLRDFFYQKLEFNMHTYCKDLTIPSNPNDPTNCTCISQALENASRLCMPLTGGEKSACLSCVTNKKGLWTAVGCVQSDLGLFVSNTLLGLGISFAGVISLLCIIYAAFMLQTSSGNPERIKKAQEMLTSCIMGLLIVIFSVFILRVVGVDILRLPGFS